MRQYLVSILIAYLSVFGVTSLDVAQNYMDKKEYGKALELYQSLREDDPASLTLAMNIAECQVHMKERDLALSTYVSYLQKYSTLDAYFVLAYIHFLIGNYEKALDELQFYFEEGGILKTEFRDMVKNLTPNAKKEIVRLSINVDDARDYAPAFYKDGILFASRRNKSRDKMGNLASDFIYAKGSKEDLTVLPDLPPELDRLNTAVNEEAIVFTDNYNQLHITRGSGRNRRAIQDLGAFPLVIDKSTNTDNKGFRKFNPFQWNRAAETRAFTGYVTFSKDKKIAVFASDFPAPGAISKFDLWYVKGDGETWLDVPVPLGKKVNTREVEFYPFIDDNGALYYSSNGQDPTRKFNLFVIKDFVRSVEEGNKINEPVRLDPIVNAKDANNYAYVSRKEGDVEWGYFTSDRDGVDNIYYFQIDGIGFIDSLRKVFDGEFNIQEGTKSVIATTKPAEVAPSIVDTIIVDPVREKILEPTTITTTVTIDTIEYVDTIYTGDFYKDGNAYYASRIPRVDARSITSQTKLSTLRSSFSEKELISASHEVNDFFETLRKVLEDSPPLTVEVGVHMPNDKEPVIQLYRSQKIANQIKGLLVNKSFDASRIVAVGYGKSKPDENLSRGRISFRILDKNHKIVSLSELVNFDYDKVKSSKHLSMVRVRDNLPISYYSVQYAALDKESPAILKKLQNRFNEKVFMDYEDSYYKYLIGNFDSYSNALSFVQRNELLDFFIVLYSPTR